MTSHEASGADAAQPGATMLPSRVSSAAADMRTRRNDISHPVKLRRRARGRPTLRRNERIYCMYCIGNRHV